VALQTNAKWQSKKVDIINGSIVIYAELRKCWKRVICIVAINFYDENDKQRKQDE